MISVMWGCSDSGQDAPLRMENDVFWLIEISATRDPDNADRIAVEIWDPLVGQTTAAFFDSVLGHMGSIRSLGAFCRKL
jgi:hypothetical protein